MQHFVWLGLTFSWQACTLERLDGKITKRIGTKPSALHSIFHSWKKSRLIVSFFDVAKTWGSLAELVRFGSVAVNYELPFLEEVSQNCFVLELWTFIFWGSLGWRVSKQHLNRICLSSPPSQEVQQSFLGESGWVRYNSAKWKRGVSNRAGAMELNGLLSSPRDRMDSSKHKICRCPCGVTRWSYFVTLSWACIK